MFTAAGEELLAELTLPLTLDKEVKKMLLQPMFINAAWQLLVFLTRHDPINEGEHAKSQWFPFSLKRICISGPLPPRVVVHAIQKTKTPLNKFAYDVTFFDVAGKPHVYLEGFTGQRIDRLMKLKL